MTKPIMRLGGQQYQAVDEAAAAQTARDNAARTLQGRGLPRANAPSRMSLKTKYLGYTPTEDEE